MAAIFAFTCSCCGEVHEGSPSFAFKRPDAYVGLSAAQKASLATADDERCVITYPDQTDRFIRVVLEVPIHGVEEPFTWGLWVSVSEKSFERYLASEGAPDEGGPFFGWLANELPGYPVDDERAADVHLQPDGYRPQLSLHEKDREHDPLMRDQRDGISVERAQALAEAVMHRPATPKAV